MKRILLSLATILAVGSIAANATTAYFNDTAQVLGSTFSAGSIDLQLDGKDQDLTATFKAEGMVPGKSYDTSCVKLKNNGTIPGKLTVKVKNLVSNENGLIDPEKDDVEGQEIDPTGYNGNTGDGELWDQITTKFCIESGAGSHSTNLICDWDDTMIKNFSSTQDDYSTTYSIPQDTDLAAGKNIVINAGEEKTFCTGVKFIDDKSTSWWGAQGSLTNNMAMTDNASLDFIFGLEQITE